MNTPHIPSKSPAHKKKMSLKPRIKAILEALCQGMFEREEIISVAFLGALSGQNSFLYGPPGTAKSLISRRIACAFENPTYFEYLMNRFSTPEEVFGPVSIKDLKEDKYTRKTESYLPTAEFAFLDEIWKSSPAILNTLLTLVNEKIFRNGVEIEPVPLKALIAASNETPEPNQGLDALYDRFILRLFVGPIEGTGNFEKLLDSPPTPATIEIPCSLRVSTNDWITWSTDLQRVKLSAETKLTIGLIREKLAAQYDTLGVYVSDRRWQRAAQLMKAAAFFNDRDETNHSDALLLAHCLWTHADNRDAVAQIVIEACEQTGFDSGLDLALLDHRKDDLDWEISKELYHEDNVYETKTIDGEEYFKISVYQRNMKVADRELFVPCEKMKTTDEFHPVDARLQEEDEITCSFDGQGSILAWYSSYYRGGYKFSETNSCTHKLHILFHKGDRKPDVNARLVAELKKSASELRQAFEEALENVNNKFEGHESRLASLFVTQEKSNIALKGIQAQIESLKLRIADCERLEALCQ